MFGLLAAFTLTACSDDESEPPIVAVESISISPSSISLERDKTYQLQAEVTPKEATEKKVSWSSSDTQVATVSENGLVTGVNRGTATVTATAGGKSATCQVTVTWEVQSVTVLPATLTMTKVGETTQLTATVAPEGAGEAVWSSSNEAVATVSPEGLVTAVGGGVATVTATAGSKTATCEVTVEISIAEIEGNEVTLYVDGASAEDVKNAITGASANGVTVFTIKGDYASTGLAYGSNPFDGVAVERLDLTSITGWPQDETGAATLPDYVFYTDSKKGIDLSNIQEVLLPEEVKSIGKSTFYKCSSLTRISAPGIERVYSGAFTSCSKLETVDMPKITYIGATAFMRTSLKTVNFPKLTEIDGQAFWFCEELTEVNLPELLTTSGAFSDCPKLEKVSLPKLIVLGTGTFSTCKALKEIELPQVTTIGMGAFQNCSSLTTVNLPQATTLENHVFYFCDALTTLKLTAKGNISVQNVTFGAGNSVSQNVDLTLNADKKEETWNEFWQKEEWKGHFWKSISFVEN